MQDTIWDGLLTIVCPNELHRDIVGGKDEKYCLG